jgi:isopenicillin N synthase-like dioxygenase
VIVTQQVSPCTLLLKMADDFSAIPVIDVAPLVAGAPERRIVADKIGSACRESGFFYITGHGVDEELQRRLEALSRRFFAQDLIKKMEVCMEKGGRAWRGYFPVGGELTSGRPDLKEGLYFGSELDDDHPLVRNETPMHGKNIFPEDVPGFRDVVLEYIAGMTKLGHLMMQGIALSLNLGESYFADQYTADPLVLFRIFNYPPDNAPADAKEWGVGEHTDYGLLTILKQAAGGLQVKSKTRWVDAHPIEGSFVCNIGDMLDRMTRGRYRSTAHRVRNPGPIDRLSCPFFFDPNFNAQVKPIDLGMPIDDNLSERWDHASVHDFEGTYGDYLLGKVAKVFPQLRRRVL